VKCRLKTLLQRVIKKRKNVDTVSEDLVKGEETEKLEIRMVICSKSFGE
jgi:hypothetical protein